MTSQEIVRESQRRRFARVEDVDDVIALDQVWRDKRWELDSVNAEFNKANKAVSKLKVAKEDATAAIAEVQAIKERMTALAEERRPPRRRSTSSSSRLATSSTTPSP